MDIISNIENDIRDSKSSNISKSLDSVHTLQILSLSELDNDYTHTLNKLKEENKKKYDELTNNIFMLEEIIEELENKTNKILNDINYLEKIFNNSLNLFIDITKNKVN